MSVWCFLGVQPLPPASAGGRRCSGLSVSITSTLRGALFQSSAIYFKTQETISGGLCLAGNDPASARSWTQRCLNAGAAPGAAPALRQRWADSLRSLEGPSDVTITTSRHEGCREVTKCSPLSGDIVEQCVFHNHPDNTNEILRTKLGE